MKDGWFMKDGVKQKQKMHFYRDFPEMNQRLKIQKGLHRILRERGLVDENKRLTDNDYSYSLKGEWIERKRGDILKRMDMEKLMEKQDDFVADSMTNLLIAIHKEHNKWAVVEFFPKCHPELNKTENGWRGGKQTYRLEQDFKRMTKQQTMDKIHKCLDAENVRIRRYARSAFFFAACYHHGTGHKEVREAVKKLKKKKKQHRVAPVPLS